jgi:hypothetical protein
MGEPSGEEVRGRRQSPNMVATGVDWKSYQLLSQGRVADQEVTGFDIEGQVFDVTQTEIGCLLAGSETHILDLDPNSHITS